ncbi:hypothetical protein I4F81_004299 [Pyropia yezoensis]|uniref:Uncharacterized protein n=1 Tax=Pyropia yezoensis TaxID=2788 RepID=A0ACC3BUX6_PYRYE|nr:hypothetical protein I4F81_004299 [Neopyropia yezoensis]
MTSLANRLVANVAAADGKTAAAMALNFFSSTGIVVANKLAMDRYGFRFATTLTLFHFIATYVLLLLAAAVGVFEKKALPLRETAKLAAGSMGFVVLTNLSLQHNSVGFYQVMKVMTTPTVVVIEALVYAKMLDWDLRAALVPVCLGVVATAATDFRLNAVGAAYAIAGVLVTSFYQIGAGTLQRSLDCSALQLQLYTAPMSAVFIVPFVPLFDDWRPSSLHSIWEYEFGVGNLSVLALTGVLAFLVNVSIFLVIGRSSAVSYNTLGHFKTCFILVSDFVLFGRPLNVRSAAGILMTMGGVFWYTHLKLDKARREQEAASSDSTSVQMAPKGGARSSTSNEVVGGDDERVALAKA